MKRRSDGKKKRISRKTKKVVGTEDEKNEIVWSSEEDKFLAEEVSRNTKVTWRTVCTKLNREFCPKKRTSVQCQKRWKTFQDSKWIYTEELLLLLGLHTYGNDWEAITLLFPMKTDPKKYVVQLLNGMAKRIKTKDAQNMEDLNVLQAFFCCKLFLEAIFNSWNSLPDVLEALQASAIEEKDCMEFLGIIGSLLNINKKWTREGLDDYLSDVMEKLQNSIVGKNKAIQAPEEVKLVRSLPVPALNFANFMLPFLFSGTLQRFSYMNLPPINYP